MSRKDTFNSFADSSGGGAGRAPAHRAPPFQFLCGFEGTFITALYRLGDLKLSIPLRIRVDEYENGILIEKKYTFQFLCGFERLHHNRGEDPADDLSIPLRIRVTVPARNHVNPMPLLSIPLRIRVMFFNGL